MKHDPPGNSNTDSNTTPKNIITTSNTESAITLKAKNTRPRTPVDPAILDLWEAYKANGLRSDRDRLLLHYAPLVKYVAGRVGVGLPASIDHNDLVSYGMFGLIDGIEKFQPERGHKFETYVVTRIRGAIIDELRSIDWVPRSVRTKMRDVDRAQTTLESLLHRQPTEREIADELTISVADLRTIYSQSSLTNVGALDELMTRGSDGDGVPSMGDNLADHRAEKPGETLESEEASRALSRAIQSLPERDRIVISLYYYENLTLAEIGQVLGVTESRVCQLHTKATAALRSRMQPDTDEL